MLNVTFQKRKGYGGYFARPTLHTCINDGLFSRVHSVMVNFYRLTALIAVFFTSFFVLANNPNPTGAPDDELFDYAFGLAPEESEQMEWFCQVSDNNFWTASGDACVAAACTHLMDNVPDTKYYEGCGVDTINLNGNNLFVAYKYTSYTVQNGSNVFPKIKGGVLINGNGTVQISQNCPPSGYNSYTMSANVGESPLCFDPIDLAMRDSCNANGTTPEFLPQSGQGASVCMTQPDGSQCKYTDQGDYYSLDVEDSCYEGNEPDYENEETQTADENNCYMVGTQQFCEANYEESCPVDQNNIAQCGDGCGFFDIGNGNVFGCFETNDNSDDPQTCEVLGTCEENPDPNPNDNIDTSGIENRIDETNSLLGDTNTNLGNIDGKLGNIESINDDMRNGIGALNDGVGNLAGIAVQTRDEIRNEAGVSFDNMQPNEGITGFYEPEYPDGWDTVWANVGPDWEASAINQYVDSWNITVAGTYTFPEFCIQFSFADYGCHSFNIDDRVFPFIRIILIVSAIFLARRLVTGG